MLDLNKHSKLEYTAKLRFLAAEDNNYSAWAKEAFNEKQDFRLHFCSGPFGDCRVKSRSKAIGFSHTDNWRLVSYRAVMRSPWASAAALEDLSVIVSRWLRDYGNRGPDNPEGELPSGGEMAEELPPEEEVRGEPKESKRRRRMASPPHELPRVDPGEDLLGDREHRVAQEAGRQAMVAMRGRSPQLLPGVAKGAGGEAAARLAQKGQVDPRKAAAPKPAASSAKVKLIPAEDRGNEPWMDDVSVLDGLGGDLQPEDSGQETGRKRKREASPGRGSTEGKRPHPGGDRSRGDFFVVNKKKVKEKKTEEGQGQKTQEKNYVIKLVKEWWRRE